MDAFADIKDRLAAVHYFADDTLATALQLALTLGRPLLLEGEAGVGKTEIAKALAAILETRLIRRSLMSGKWRKSSACTADGEMITDG